MDKPIFILWCLFGLGVAFAVFLSLGPRRRSRISPLIWSGCMIVGAVTCMFGLSHSTTPSFASRTIAIGQASAFSEQKAGRRTAFGFHFVPEEGNALSLGTQIIVPHWSNSAVFSGRTLRITYLNDPVRSISNEVIEIEILSGDDAGWHDSLDARPYGVWLGIPIGGLVAGFGYIGIRYRKDDLEASKLSETAA